MLGSCFRVENLKVVPYKLPKVDFIFLFKWHLLRKFQRQWPFVMADTQWFYCPTQQPKDKANMNIVSLWNNLKKKHVQEKKFYCFCNWKLTEIAALVTLNNGYFIHGKTLFSVVFFASFNTIQCWWTIKWSDYVFSKK